MICNRSPLNGSAAGKQLVVTIAEQSGCRWSRSSPVRKMCSNCASGLGRARSLAGLRDQVRELNRTIQFMRAKYSLRGDVSTKLRLDNFRAAVFLSQLLAAAGQTQETLNMRRGAAAWNDAHQAKLGTVYAIRLRATILMLDGKQDAGLSELAESFKKADYENWWYTLVLDPLWMPLHEDPRFRAISAEVKRYIGAQREQLEVLRRDGQVPRRGSPESAR